VRKRRRLDEDVSTRCGNEVDAGALGIWEALTIGAESREDRCKRLAVLVEPRSVATGSDCGDEEPDAVVAGKRPFAVLDQLAEALSDVPESQNAQADIAYVAHG